MPQKYDEASPGEKLLRLFRCLMADGGKHFLPDLAEDLRCSPQTVARHIRAIATALGDSLEEGMEGRRRWYRLRVSTLGLGGLGGPEREFEELRCLGVGRNLLARILPEAVLRRMDGSLVQFALLLAESNKGNTDRFSFFSKGRIDYSGQWEHIQTLLKAIEERCVCLVRYRAAGRAEHAERRFAPRQMIAMNGALYTLGADVAEDRALRRLTNLAVHRIQAVVLTEERHTLDIPAAEAGAFGLPWHEPRHFRIRFTPGKAADYVRERIWADSQHLEDLEDGGLILSLTTRSEPELAAWVRSFGPDAAFVPGCGSGDASVSIYEQEMRA